MTLKERIESFSLLGKKIRKLSENDFLELAARVENNNNWFTPDQTRFALNGIADMLDTDALRDWLGNYPLDEKPGSKSVGVLMAGNIPAVGFHDFMCVLLSGHQLHAKLSKSDQVLIKWLAAELTTINPEFRSRIFFQEMLKGMDAYIATGSDNSARYFTYYFGKYPNIIRKNRTSVAVLSGQEEERDYIDLGHDIFQYYGLGCRNVSKLYLRDEDQLHGFLQAINGFNFLLSHHKYLNNYEYNKSIFLINQEHHLDNSFLLLKENDGLVSPISVVYYEYYEDVDHLKQTLDQNSSQIQCIVSKNGWYPESKPFGQAQTPSVTDYADNVDTMAFLTSL